ncbi:hypothetical protein FGG08_006102, partial [Glutinoglossum americanum]
MEAGGLYQPITPPDRKPTFRDIYGFPLCQPLTSEGRRNRNIAKAELRRISRRETATDEAYRREKERFAEAQLSYSSRRRRKRRAEHRGEGGDMDRGGTWEGEPPRESRHHGSKANTEERPQLLVGPLQYMMRGALGGTGDPGSTTSRPNRSSGTGSAGSSTGGSSSAGSPTGRSLYPPLDPLPSQVEDRFKDPQPLVDIATLAEPGREATQRSAEEASDPTWPAWRPTRLPLYPENRMLKNSQLSVDPTFLAEFRSGGTHTPPSAGGAEKPLYPRLPPEGMASGLSAERGLDRYLESRRPWGLSFLTEGPNAPLPQTPRRESSRGPASPTDPYPPINLDRLWELGTPSPLSHPDLLRDLDLPSPRRNPDLMGDPGRPGSPRTLNPRPRNLVPLAGFGG